MSYVLDGGQFDHSIEELTRRAFEHDLIPLKEVIGTGKSLICFAEVATAAARDFAAERADAALRLHMLLKARLIREHMTRVLRDVERPLVPVVATMEHARGQGRPRGACRTVARFRPPRRRDRGAGLARRRATSSTSARPSNWARSCSRSSACPAARRARPAPTAPTPRCWNTWRRCTRCRAQVLEWRQLTKLKSTYADALGDADRPQDRPRPHLLRAGGDLDRAAVLDRPNLQNIPVRTEEGRKIRRAFVAEPGHLLLSADYSQIELRLAGACRRNRRAEATPSATGSTSTRMTASEVFGVPVDRHGPATRRRAKAINFGIIYGISAFGLGNQLGVPQGEAARIHPRLLRALPRHPRLHGADQAGRAPHRLCRDAVRPQCCIPGIRDANPARARRRRARRRSTRPCRARPPTSSSGRWSACPRR